jgi:predicted ATP-binding protein involved in virulence
MRIKSLSIENFRGIEELTLEFNTLEPIVFIGVNGVGKSSILDCLTNLIRIFICNISDVQSPEYFRDFDIKNDFQNMRIELLLSINSKEGSVIVNKNRRELSISGLPKETENTGMEFDVYQLKKEFGDLNKKKILPLAISYSSKRLVSAFELDESIIEQSYPFNAYKSFLDSSFGFEDFFQWFKNREDIENEFMRDNPIHRDLQLGSVREAIYKLIPDFQELRVRRSPLRMTVNKKNQELLLDQLSDGEKCLLAMVGDLARRLAIANPGLSDPLQGTGVILIDEIELHLHPGWQYEIIPALTRTFPNCQFIVTTHSPIVLSQVKPEGIFCLEKKDGKVIAYHPDSSYGRDTNRILEDLMGVPERPQTFKNQLRTLFRFIDEGDLDKARALQHHLEMEIGLDEPEFARADVLIRRQEILGR